MHSGHWLFAQNVFAHLVASMSGVASFIIAMYEHSRQRKVTSRAFFVIGVICLVMAFDQAWQDEHNNTNNLIAEKSVLWQERDFWKEQSYAKDSSLRSLNELLGKNYGVLSDTQSSLAKLSNRLLDVAGPAPLKIDAHRWKIPETYTYQKGVGFNSGC